MADVRLYAMSMSAHAEHVIKSAGCGAVKSCGEDKAAAGRGAHAVT